MSSHSMNPRILEEGHLGCDSASYCVTGAGEVDLNPTKARIDCEVANCPDLFFCVRSTICSRREHVGGLRGVHSTNLRHLFQVEYITQVSGVENRDSSQKYVERLLPRPSVSLRHWCRDPPRVLAELPAHHTAHRPRNHHDNVKNRSTSPR